MRSQSAHANLLLLLTAAIWGVGFVAQSAGMDSVGPMLYNGLRFLLGALVVLPMALRADPQAEQARQVRGGALLAWGTGAGALLFLAASLQQVGLLYTTVANAGFITGLYVILVPMLGLLLGHRTGLGTWLGASLAVGGMYLLSVGADLAIGRGDLLQLAGALFWAVHVLVVGAIASRTHAVRLACTQFFVCGLLSLAVALVVEPIELAAIVDGALPILFGGVMSVGVGYTLQVVAQKHAVASHAAIILSLEAVFAALAGWLLLGETLGLRAISGCALMLCGMLLAQLWPARRRAWG